MIEYLEKLLDGAEYEKALAYSEQLMIDRHSTVTDLMSINCAVLVCRYMLKEYHGAIISGQLAVRLAQDLEHWDCFGVGSLFLGLAHDRLGQTDQAIHYWYGYLSKVSYYQKAAAHEAKVWYNLGLVHSRLGNGQQALKALEEALEVSQRLGNQRYAHGIRHAMIAVYTQSGDYTLVPGLLAQCHDFLRKCPDQTLVQESWLFHYRLRADFALAANRLNRAIKMANHGLKRAHREPRHQFQFHMILAQVYYKMGQAGDALGHALSARIFAMAERRHDLECKASEFMYEITKLDPLAVQEIHYGYGPHEINLVMDHSWRL